MKELRKVVAQRLLELKKSKNISSQKEFAEMCGLSADTISKVINQRGNLSIKNAKQISKHMGVSLDYIYGNSDSEDMSSYAVDVINKHLRFAIIDDFDSELESSDILKKYLQTLYDTEHHETMPDELKQKWIESVKNEFIAALRNGTIPERKKYHISYSRMS